MQVFFRLIVTLCVIAHAKSDPFPEWVRCSEEKECTSIQGTCREWEYVNRAFARDREKENIRRRAISKCVYGQDHMQEAPAAACFHGVCTAKSVLENKPERCADYVQFLDNTYTLANSCEKHEDCERGLASCGEECEFHVYPKAAKGILQKWQEHYTNLCQPRCHNTCVDPARYVSASYGVRCILGRCSYIPLRQTLSQ